MSYDNILTEHKDGVLRITLNRPKKLNALSPTLLAELKSALHEVEHDDNTKVIILRSSGKVFSAGYDLSEEEWIISQFPADFEHGVDLQQDREDIIGLLKYWLSIWNYPKPVIAQVQGPALSGAGELLAVCDLVVASPAASTMFLWPLLIGMRKTKELLYTGRSIGAEEAQRLGLINEVVAEEQLESHVEALAIDIARSPANHLALLKESTNNWYENMGMQNSSFQAADLDAVFHQSPTFKAFFDLVKNEGMKAALEERKKQFG